METGIADLTDMQRRVLASGKALAEDFGLMEFSLSMQKITISDSDRTMAQYLGFTKTSSLAPSNEIELKEGQTVLISSPYGTTIGAIQVIESYSLPKIRNTEYFLNDEVLFQKRQQLMDRKWVTVFSADLNIPANSTLYVS